MLKRINTLIKASSRDPFEGIGKPEPLKHGLSGYWSRRINDEHRFVYKVSDDGLLTAQLRYHYNNACICGLGEVAAFLRLFAKKVTVYPNPARCTC